MKKAFVFPGQGSQQPGMGRYLYENFKLAQSLFEEASDAIHLDFKKLCFDSTDSELAMTHNTQPAIVGVSVATARVLQTEFGQNPNYTAGHSVGEYAALVISEVLSFSDAMKAVRLRGQYMQEAVPVGKGAMVATLGLSNDQAQILCQFVEKESGFSPLSPANFNCPGQVVLSGSSAAVEWARATLKLEDLFPETKRIKMIPLNVSAPFHCSLMKPAEEKMKIALDEMTFHEAKIPVIQNVHAKAETSAKHIRENLISQISKSVLWTQTMQEMSSIGCTNIIECGHGSVLKGLFKKAEAEFNIFSTQSLDDLKSIT